MNVRKRLFVILLCLLFVAVLGFIISIITQVKFDRKKMDAFFKHIENNDMGLGSISIFQNGNEVYHNQIGFAEFETGRKNNKNTLFRIGSVSKSFTAVVIMQLVRENKLSLETKLSDYFPEIKNSENITIRNLLEHKSGIFNFTSDKTFSEWKHLPASKNDLIKRISSYEPIFEAGDKQDYSDSNYTLLGFIAEMIDNNSLENILRKRIINPAVLNNTFTINNSKSHYNIAKSYYKRDEWIPAVEVHESILTGFANIISSPFDLNKYFYNFFHGRLVPDELLAEMIPMEDMFGLGIAYIPFYEKLGYGNQGYVDAFQATTIYFPIEQVTITFMSNGNVINHDDVIIGALSIYFGREYEFPEF